MKDLIFVLSIAFTVAAASMLKTQNTQDIKPVMNQKYLSYSR